MVVDLGHELLVDIIQKHVLNVLLALLRSNPLGFLLNERLFLLSGECLFEALVLFEVLFEHFFVSLQLQLLFGVEVALGFEV